MRSNPLQADKKDCGDAFRQGCVCNKAVRGLNGHGRLVVFGAGVINARLVLGGVRMENWGRRSF